MSLQEVKEQAFKLSVGDRLALVNFIVESVKGELGDRSSPTEPIERGFADLRDRSIQEDLLAERASLIDRMRGLLKTGEPAPTDAEVQAMLGERRVEKYLQ